MEKKKFKRYEKAMIDDLNRVKSFSTYKIGLFYGFLSCNKTWLEMNKHQYKILKDYIKKTFSSKNFKFFNGKRKENSMIKVKSPNKARSKKK